MIALFVESLVAGGITGLFSGLLGVGGGFILIPLLTLMGVPIHTAVGTCLAFVACASLTGLIQHARQGTIDPAVALTMTFPAALMASFAARFSSLFAPHVLHLLFSVLLVGIMVMYHFAPAARPLETLPPPAPTSRCYILHRQRLIGNLLYQYDFHMLKAILCGMATGLLTGFFGIGGGVLLVPLTVVVLHVPLRVTAGSSLAVFILPSLVGAITHGRLGNVDVNLLLPLVVAGMAGSQVGARYVLHLSPAILKRLFLLLILAGAVLMLVKGLTE